VSPPFDKSSILFTGMLITLLFALPSSGGDLPIKQFDVTLDPPIDGEQIVTIRMTPELSETYDKLVFDNYLSQQTMISLSDGTRRLKTIEPVFFTHRERNVKLVDGLDRYISYRVPVGGDRLKQAFGAKVFKPAIPVHISRVKIKAIKDGSTVWKKELKPAAE